MSVLPCGTSEEALWEIAEGTGADMGLLEHAGACEACRARLEEMRRLCSGLASLGNTPAVRLPERIGSYRIIRLIGEGGMGTVFEAEQSNPARRVALKVSRAGHAGPEHIKAFKKEVYALGRLNDSAIAHIYDAGQTDEGQPYFVMELVKGTALDRHCDQKGLDLRRRLELLAQVAEAVHRAHERGIIHRDLKPANILVDEKGQPRVLDFGLARLVSSDVEPPFSLTVGPGAVGTLPYMSPEQLLGSAEDVDERADVYALGVILHGLLTGRHPYPISGGLGETARAILDHEPEPPSSTAAVDRTLDAIVLKARAKRREGRYASAAALADDLRRYLAGRVVRARSVSRLGRLTLWARRERAKATIAGLCLAIAALGIIMLTRPAEKRPPLRLVWESAPGSALSGRPSPDGRYVIFWGEENGPHFELRDLDLGRSRRLVEGNWDDDDPAFSDGGVAWSPDGRHIAYQWFERDHWQLRVIGVDDEFPRTLLRRQEPGYISLHAWTRDGSAVIVSVSEGGPSEVATVSLEDARVHVLRVFDSIPAQRISPSPDGRHLAYARSQGSHNPTLFALDLESGVETRLLEEGPHANRNPHWTPDGQWIVFASDRMEGQGAWALPVRDGKPRGEPRLLRSRVGPLGISAEGALFYGINRNSFDVWVARFDPASGELSEAKKASVRFEGHNRNADWSWDGQRLAFLSHRLGKREFLSVRSVASGEEQDIELPAGFETPRTRPRWSPDGSILICGTVDGECGVHRIEVGSGERKLLFRGETERLEVSPDGQELAMSIRTPERQEWRTILRNMRTGAEQDLGPGLLFAYSPDGRLRAVAGEGQIRILDQALGEVREAIPLPAGQRLERSFGLQWLDDRHVICALQGEQLRVWRLSVVSGEAVPLPWDTELMSAARLSRDRRYVAYNGPGPDKGADIWVMEDLPERLASFEVGPAAGK